MRDTTDQPRIQRIASRRRGRGVLPPREQISERRRAWWVWAVSLSFVLFQFFLQLSSGEMVAGLMDSFSLGAAGGGVLISSYYFIYVLLQAPAGMMIDRYGPRKLLSVGACVVMVGCVLFATTHHLIVAIIGRLLMGSGAAFAFVGSLNLISRWFPANRFGVLAAFAETFGMFGSVIGSLCLAASIQQVGWRSCMLAAAGVSLLLAILLWVVVRDTPDNVTMITARPNGLWWSDMKGFLKNKLAWLNGMYAGLLFIIVTVFIALWGVPFLQVAYHMSLMEATWISDMVFVGVAIGCPLIGWIDARIERRQLYMMVCPLVCAGLLGLIIYLPGLSHLEIAVLMFLLGLATSAYVVPYIIGNEIAEPGMRTTSIGFVNTLAVGTAPLFGPLIGWALDHPLRVSMQEAASAVLPYHEAFSLLIVGLLVASFIGYSLPNRQSLLVVVEGTAPSSTV